MNYMYSQVISINRHNTYYILCLHALLVGCPVVIAKGMYQDDVTLNSEEIKCIALSIVVVLG